MKEEIKESINNPQKLELLYRSNNKLFKESFFLVYNSDTPSEIEQCWQERLKENNKGISFGSSKEGWFVVGLCALAIFLLYIPSIFFQYDTYPISSEYYQRYFGFFTFPLIILLVGWKNNFEGSRIKYTIFGISISLLYIMLLGAKPHSQTATLASIYLPFFFWGLLGLVKSKDTLSNRTARIDYLRFTADVLVLTGVILLAGVVLVITASFLLGTFGENFSLIEFLAKSGLVSSPIVAAYVVINNPTLVNKVSPVIAKLFTPLFLLVLLVFSVSIFESSKIFEDRDFLLTLNIVLAITISLILFSIIEASEKINYFSDFTLVSLAIVSIVINLTCLLAISIRLFDLGITPNRFVVLGSNLLMLTNLIILTISLRKSFNNQSNKEMVKMALARFLPIYSIWTIFVIFILPILFWFK